MNFKQHKRLLKRLLYITVLIVYIVVVLKYWSDITSLIYSHPFALLYAVVLSLIAIAVQTINFLDIINKINIIRFLPTYRIWALSNLLNYAAPFQPGLVVRGAYFKTKNISYQKFALGTIRQMQLSLWIGLALLAYFLSADILASIYLKFLALFIFLLWFFSMIYIERGGKLPFLSLKYSDKASYLFSTPTIQQFLLINIQYLLIASSYYLVLSELGIEITVNMSYLIAIGLVFSTIISITPNNIGLQELIIGAVVFNLTSTEAYTVVVPVIFRLSHVISCGLILCLATTYNKNQVVLK